MSIVPISKKGLQFSLEKEYERLLVERHGLDFWYIPNQRLLRTKLAPFLPRMEYDAVGNKVIASLVEGGEELLSSSQAATPSLSNVPDAELKKLRNALEELQKEVNDPLTAEATKQLVRAFSLPNPDKAPELYRLYGKGKNKRLAIIWGLGKNVVTNDGGVVSSTSAATNVKLEDMPTVLPGAVGGASSSSRKWWPWILLLLAAGGLTYCLMSGSDEDKVSPTNPQSSQPSDAKPNGDATANQNNGSATTPSGDTTSAPASMPSASGVVSPTPDDTDGTKDAPNGCTEDGTEDGTKDGTKDAPDGCTEDGTKDAPDGCTEDGTKDVPDGCTEDAPNGCTEDGTKDAPNGCTEDGTKDAPDGGTEDGTDDAPNGCTEDDTKDAPDGGIEDGTDDAPNGCTEDDTKDAPNGCTEDDSKGDTEDGTKAGTEAGTDDGTEDGTDKDPKVQGPESTSVIPDGTAMDALTHDCVYKVNVIKNGQLIGTGTAFAISQDKVVTNEHVITEFNKPGVEYVLTRDGAPSVSIKLTECVVKDGSRDLAVMQTNSNSMKYLKVQREEEPRVGEVVYVKGYPLGLCSTLTMGSVSGRFTENGVRFFLHTAPVSPGSSGSPILNTKGEVVGVLIGNIPGKDSQAQSLNIAVWIGELDGSKAKLPKDGHVTVPEDVPPAPVSDDKSIMAPPHKAVQPPTEEGGAPTATEVPQKPVIGPDEKSPITAAPTDPDQSPANNPSVSNPKTPTRPVSIGYTINPDPYTVKLISSETLEDGKVKHTFLVSATGNVVIQSVSINGVEKKGTGTLEVTVSPDSSTVDLKVSTNKGVYSKPLEIEKC